MSSIDEKFQKVIAENAAPADEELKEDAATGDTAIKKGAVPPQPSPLSNSATEVGGSTKEKPEGPDNVGKKAAAPVGTTGDSTIKTKPSGASSSMPGALSGQIFDDVAKEGETLSEDEVKEDITAILSGADLDEEFQKKATTVFEAAVAAKVTSEVAKLKETAEGRISEELEKIKEEFAFVPNHVAEQFFASVYPTITSGKSTKVIIISTPNGMNHFYKMWEDARRGNNGYVTNEVHWSQVPGRDAKWKEETLKNTSKRQFAQEFECDFLGSADTLISPSKLQTIPFHDPIQSNAGLDVYKRAEENHEYIITVDVARGIGGDYSAFLVFDISSIPYQIVAKYRNNEIKPVLFPSVIFQVAKEYNNPYILVEVNDIGDSIAATLNYDLEYPNVLMCAMRGRAGQVVGQGFSGTKTQLGVKMSVTVKKIGCANLKAIIEEDKLLFNDFQIFQELTTFVQKKQAWEADEGYHDDLVMCMVLFAWLVMQDYFKEMTDQDIRRRIYEEQRNQIEQDMAPFGFIDDGLGDDTFVDAEGSFWYGDKQEEVSYMLPDL